MKKMRKVREKSKEELANFHRRLDELYLLEKASADLTAISKELSGAYVRAAAVFHPLQKIEPDRVVAYMTQNGEFGADEVARYQQLSAVLREGNATRPISISESGMSISEIDALAGADEHVQSEGFKLLDARKRLRTGEIAARSEARRWNSKPDWAPLEQERHSSLKALAQLNLDARLANLESRVLELIGDLYPLIDGSYRNWTEMELSANHTSLVERASALLPIFESFFGGVERMLSSGHEDAPHLAACYYALEQISQGRFGEDFGFQVHKSVGRGSIAILDALYCLVPFDDSHPTAPQDLKVLELCAGAGGMALGLDAAGFEHVGLYDNYVRSIETILANRPKWPISHGDIEKLGNDVFEKFRGVDLLAAGLPCGPGENVYRKPDLHRRVLEIIEYVLPKAFIIESGSGNRKKGVALDARAKFMASEKLSKYKVVNFSIDTVEFGLPHSTERRFFVGIRKDITRNFVEPVIQPLSIETIDAKIKAAKHKQARKVVESQVPGYRRNIGQVLSSVVAIHESPVGTHNKSEEQKTYDRWASDWRNNSRGLLPGIPSKQEERSERVKAVWSSDSKGGFDRTGKIVEKPPTFAAVIADDALLPSLTYDALAVAQGFPPTWTFSPKKDAKLPMIQSALPPVVARMVGLCVRSALTGRKFDLDKLVEEPIGRIQARRVDLIDGLGGVKRLRQSPPPKRITDAPPWADPIKHSAVYFQALRALGGEPLEVVEPRKKLRPAVKKMMVEIQSERDEDFNDRDAEADWAESQSAMWDLQ